MLTDTDAATYLAQLHRDREDAFACVEAAKALEARASGVGYLIERRRIDLGSRDDVHLASLVALVHWYRDHALPGFPLNLEAASVFTALELQQGRSRYHYRDVSGVTPESLMDYLRRTYGPTVRDHARATLHQRLERALWLKQTRQERGTLVLHIGARSEISYSSRQRELGFAGREQVVRALQEVTRAITFEGHTLPERPDALEPGCVTFTNALTTDFRYRAKVPVALGHLVLFKDYVELVLDPTLAPAFALFLASAEPEKAAA